MSGAFGAGITPTLTYDANNAYLTLAADPLAPVVSNGTPNKQAVAQGLDRAMLRGANVFSYFALYNLPASAMPQALTQISGIVHSSVGSVGSTASSQFVSSLADQIGHRPG